MTKSEAINKLSDSYTRKVVEKALEDHEEIVEEQTMPVSDDEIEIF